MPPRHHEILKMTTPAADPGRIDLGPRRQGGAPLWGRGRPRRCCDRSLPLGFRVRARHASPLRACPHEGEAPGLPPPGHGLVGARIAVGTALTGGPPHRSQRAELPHWAPASGDERRIEYRGRGAARAGVATIGWRGDPYVARSRWSTGCGAGARVASDV